MQKRHIHDEGHDLRTGVFMCYNFIYDDFDQDMDHLYNILTCVAANPDLCLFYKATL